MTVAFGRRQDDLCSLVCVVWLGPELPIANLSPRMVPSPICSQIAMIGSFPEKYCGVIVELGFQLSGWVVQDDRAMKDVAGRKIAEELSTFGGQNPLSRY